MPRRKKPEFRELIERHAHEIHAFLWRMLLDGPEAEDCLQDSFLKAFQAYDRLDAQANVRAWLYAIAGNTARSRLRQRMRTGSFLKDDEPDQAPDVERAVEGRLLLEAVQEAVEGLPHKQRISLILRRYQELSYEEIAEVLDISPESARANVYQATKKLRAQFKEPEHQIGLELSGVPSETRSQTA